MTIEKFRAERIVLFGDCDPGGIMYTPRISDYLVEAVLAFQAARLGGAAARKIFGMGILPPARSLSIEFLSPLTWDERIALEVSCVSIGKTSFTCEVLAIRDDKRVAFVGRITQVCISPESKRPVPIPKQLRAALQ